jgi:hypothetical protein
MSEPTVKTSIQVLRDCADLQLRKSRDYQNPLSRIKQAHHYPRGCATILDMAYQKLIRMYSLMDAAEAGVEANFESLEDSSKDAINYLSFFVEYARGEMSGQNPDNDMFNRPKPKVIDDKCK